MVVMLSSLAGPAASGRDGPRLGPAVPPSPPRREACWGMTNSGLRRDELAAFLRTRRAA
ncbi:hypothetical protein NKG94_28155 [Micromonospora sp. M12]